MFLTLNDILSIHADMIESYGGAAGVLDIGKIESALAQPQGRLTVSFFTQTFS